MANIQIPVSTSSLGPVAGLFYYIYNDDLTSVNYSGDVISTYFKSSYTGDIQYITYAGSSLFSFDYDGAIFFTAEKNYDTITFRRWIIDLDTLSLREIKASSFPQDGYYSFDNRVSRTIVLLVIKASFIELKVLSNSVSFFIYTSICSESFCQTLIVNTISTNCHNFPIILCT